MDTNSLMNAYNALANGLTALLGEEKALAVKLTAIPEVGTQNLADLDQIITDTQGLQVQVQSLITHFSVPSTDIPLIHGITPDNGSILGGTPVIIDGHHFTGVTKLWFGTIPCIDFAVVNDDTIDATTPKGLEPGDVFVTATSPMGTSLTEGDEVVAAFTYADLAVKDGVAIDGGEAEEEDQGVKIAEPIGRGSRW